MASESEFPEFSSLIEQLINSRNPSVVPLLLPFIVALADEEDGPNPTVSPDRVIFVNPNNQDMVVIGGTDRSDSNTGSGSGLESMLRDLFGGKPGQPPASKASMEAMPDVEVTEAGKDCVICLEDFEVGEFAKEMPCKHKFHGACVEKWLRVHGTCPTCRFRMPVEEADEGSAKNGGGQEEEGDDGRRRRREIWVSFTVRNNANGSSAEESSSPSN